MAFGLFKKKSSSKEGKSSGPKYHDLTVKEIRQETSDAISIVFDTTVNEIPYKSGQFLTLISDIEGKEVRRAYSLSSSPALDENLTVTIKRVEGGLMSNHLPDHLKVGDVVKVMKPMGTFTTEYDKNRKRHIIMFGGGSGITPMMSILKSTLLEEPKSIVSLIYCNRNIDSIIFKQELTDWEMKHEGRLHVIHVLDDAPMNWQGYSGLLNHDMLESLCERIPDWGTDATTYLMCGPEGMMKNVDQLLKERNIPYENIFKESFVQGTIDKAHEDVLPADEANKESTVTIHYDGDTHEVKVKKGEFILETALDAGIDLPFSCQSGLCTACRCKKVSGEVEMVEDEGLSESEKEEGFVLICVSHPKTENIELEVG